LKLTTGGGGIIADHVAGLLMTGKAGASNEKARVAHHLCFFNLFIHSASVPPQFAVLDGPDSSQMLMAGGKLTRVFSLRIFTMQ
jgi:hypothetical protein